MRFRKDDQVLVISLFCAIVLLACGSRKETASNPAVLERVGVKVNWDKVAYVSKTIPSLQVVVNPPMRRGTAIHDAIFQGLKELGCDAVRYVPWYPYPKLVVAELEPPADGKTSWDFSLIDPMTEDFMNAMAGHSVIMNFSTIPQWMFKTDKPIAYPSDPDGVTWTYTQGTEPRDPSLKEIGDYFARLVSWYTQGGFTDEYGKHHESGHHYKFDYWEVLNEVNAEHRMTPQMYSRTYDVIVEAIHGVDPRIKFVGPALGRPRRDYMEYFLNHQNHKPGIPLDFVSYHFYAAPTPDQTPEMIQYTYWEQADHFLDVVGYIQNVRERLSPQTGTIIDEIGSQEPDDFNEGKPGYVFKDFPQSYWNLSGATYAYVYTELAKLGVDVANESQWVGYPSQFPSVSMVDWNTGKPNTRAQVLKLLHDNFGPSDKLVETAMSSRYVYGQAFATRAGRRKVLLINKRDRTFEVSVPGAQGADSSYIDETTGFQPPASSKLTSEQVLLQGFAVVVVTLPQ